MLQALHGPGARRVVHPGRDLLLQDRGGARGGGDPRGSAGGDHDVSRARHAADGAQERDRALAALGGDARLHVGHLLGQDRHAHHQPDDCLQGTPTPIANSCSLLFFTEGAFEGQWLDYLWMAVHTIRVRL